MMELENKKVSEDSILFQLFKKLLSNEDNQMRTDSDNVRIVDNRMFFLYQNGELLKYNFNDLLYIRADGSYSKLYIIDDNKIKCLHVTGNIRSIERCINNRYFIRTHRSFIVNMLYAKSITRNRIFFDFNYKEHFAKISQDGLKKISNMFPIIGCKL